MIDNCIVLKKYIFMKSVVLFQNQNIKCLVLEFYNRNANLTAETFLVISLRSMFLNGLKSKY